MTKGWNFFVACIALLPLIAWSQTQATQSPCKVNSFNGEIVAYQGACVNGFIEGPAEILLQRKRSSGDLLAYKVYGMFQRGQAVGRVVHLMGVSNLVYLWFFDGAGERVWEFATFANGATGDSGSWIASDWNAPGFVLRTSKSGTQSIQAPDLLRQSEKYAADRKVPSVGTNALLLYLESLAGKSVAQSVSQLVANKALFPSDLPGLAVRHQVRADELVVHTREGCGLIIPFHLGAMDRPMVTDGYLQNSWLGECVDGLALGPGKMLMRAGGEVASTRSAWYLYGRPIGWGVTTILPVPAKAIGGRVIDDFNWDGIQYERSRSAQAIPVPRKWFNDPPMIGVASNQRRVSYRLKLARQGTSDCNGAGVSCLEIDSTENGSQILPCTDDCDALWMEKAVLLVEELKAAEARYKPAIEAAKKTAERILGELQAMRVREAMQREGELAAVVRAQALTHANQSRQPVASPNLDALIKGALK